MRQSTGTPKFPELCAFCQKRICYLKKIEILFLRLVCSSFIPQLYTESWFKIWTVVFQIFLYGACLGVILSKRLVVYNCRILYMYIAFNFFLSEYGYRTCSPEGRWEGQKPGDYSEPQGYTNYTDCYTPEVLALYEKYFSSKTPAQQKVTRIHCMPYCLYDIFPT